MVPSNLVSRYKVNGRVIFGHTDDIEDDGQEDNFRSAKDVRNLCGSRLSSSGNDSAEHTHRGE